MGRHHLPGSPVGGAEPLYRQRPRLDRAISAVIRLSDQRDAEPNADDGDLIGRLTDQNVSWCRGGSLQATTTMSLSRSGGR